MFCDTAQIQVFSYRSGFSSWWKPREVEQVSGYEVVAYFLPFNERSQSFTMRLSLSSGNKVVAHDWIRTLKRWTSNGVSELHLRLVVSFHLPVQCSSRRKFRTPTRPASSHQRVSRQLPSTEAAAHVPTNVARTVRMCGRRGAHSKPGGASPHCYEEM